MKYLILTKIAPKHHEDIFIKYVCTNFHTSFQLSNVHLHTHINKHKHTHTYTQTNTHTHTYAHTQTYTYTQIFNNMLPPEIFPDIDIQNRGTYREVTDKGVSFIHTFQFDIVFTVIYE